MKKFLYTVLTLTLLMSVFYIGAEAVVLDDLDDSDCQYYSSGYRIWEEVVEDYRNGKFGDEVFYLSDRSLWGISKSDMAVFRRNGVPVAVWYELDERCSERELTEDEYNDFVASLKEIEADSLPDWDKGWVDDGGDNDYIHISKDTKAAVYMNNPGHDGSGDGSNQIYLSLIKKFRDLFEIGKFKTYYDIDGAELLINRDDYCVRSVYKNGSDFRVLIKDKENSTYDYEKLEWHSFRFNTVGKIVDEPEGFTMEKAWDDIPGNAFCEKHLNNYPWQTTWGDYTVKTWKIKERDLRINGLFITKPDEEPVLVCKGKYSNPVVIPGTDFVVCEEGDNGWQNPRKLVKINLRTFEKTDMDFPRSKYITPETCINGKLLLWWQSTDGESGYYMYDASEDTINRVYGDFNFTELEGRNMQPTNLPNKYFILGNQYTVGIFDTEAYTFTKLAEYPICIYNNDYMWVDENKGKIYIVVNNDLISLPIDTGSSGNVLSDYFSSFSYIYPAIFSIVLMGAS